MPQRPEGTQTSVSGGYFYASTSARRLYELWLLDPTGYNVEVYACLTPDELATMPADKRPNFLVAGTGP